MVSAGVPVSGAAVGGCRPEYGSRSTTCSTQHGGRQHVVLGLRGARTRLCHECLLAEIAACSVDWGLSLFRRCRSPSTCATFTRSRAARDTILPSRLHLHAQTEPMSPLVCSRSRLQKDCRNVGRCRSYSLVGIKRSLVESEQNYLHGHTSLHLKPDPGVSRRAPGDRQCGLPGRDRNLPTTRAHRVRRADLRRCKSAAANLRMSSKCPSLRAR